MSGTHYGIDELRETVAAFDGVRESFNQEYTARQLLLIRRAWLQCEWDFSPDQWKSWQVNEALAGFVPQWDDAGVAVTSMRKVSK
jgi:hypothetical protein